MAYFDNYQLAGDERDRLLQEIMASRQQAQAAQSDQAMANQIATELANAQQPAPQAAQVQAMPAPNNGLTGTAAQFTPLDTMGRIVGRQIYDLKGGYDEAAKAGDMEAAKRFADAASNIRDYSQKYGVDVSRFGSDVTRDQLGTLLQADAARGIQDMQNMKTSQEYFYEAKQRYLDQGVSDRRATQMAIDETRRYEGEYARKMASAMINYGVNDQSEMNRYAPFFAQMLYNNDPQSMAVFDAYQVNPKEQWKYNKDLEAARFMNTLRQANSLQNYEQTRALNQDKYAFQGGENEANRQHQMTMLALKAQIDAKTEADRRAWIESNPELAGILYGRKGSGGTSGGSNGVSESKMNEVMGTLAQLKSELFHGGLSVTDYLDKVAKYRLYVDEDTAWLAQAYGYVKNFLDSYAAGYKGDALKYWNDIKDDDELLAEIPADIIADMRKRAQAASKSSSSSNNEKAQRSAPQMDENAKAQASVGDEALARAREEEKKKAELIAQRRAEAGY